MARPQFRKAYRKMQYRDMKKTKNENNTETEPILRLGATAGSPSNNQVAPKQLSS